MPDTNAAYEAPSSVVRQATVAAASAGADLNTNVYRVLADGVVDAVKYAPAAAITGANTDSRTVSLVNKGAAGSGTTVIATLPMISGVNSSAAVEKTIPLSGTAGNLAVSAGDILQWQSAHVGAGLADPGGLLVITLGRT